MSKELNELYALTIKNAYSTVILSTYTLCTVFFTHILTVIISVGLIWDVVLYIDNPILKTIIIITLTIAGIFNIIRSSINFHVNIKQYVDSITFDNSTGIVTTIAYMYNQNLSVDIAEESIKKVYDINMLSVITQVIFYYFGFQKNCVIKFYLKRSNAIE
mgnify:FL=1